MKIFLVYRHPSDGSDVYLHHIIAVIRAETPQAAARAMHGSLENGEGPFSTDFDNGVSDAGDSWPVHLEPSFFKEKPEGTTGRRRGKGFQRLIPELDFTLEFRENSSGEEVDPYWLAEIPAIDVPEDT